MSGTADGGGIAPGGAIGAVARRPGLWVEAIRSLVALAPGRWWSRFPFTPSPDPAYLAWRTATAYGSPEAEIDPDDLVAYLEWRRAFRRAVHR